MEKTPKVKVSERKFYRTVITFEVLSEECLPSDLSLEQIAVECEHGDWSGCFLNVESEMVDAPAVAGLLEKQGSEPMFFGLTKDGEEVDDESHED